MAPPGGPPLATAIERPIPDTACLLIEGAKPVPIARQTEVSVVSAQNAAQPLVLRHHRRMHPPPRLNTQFFKLPREPHAVGAAFDHETPVPTPRTIVRKTQEPERLATSSAAPAPQLTCQLAELDEAWLLLLQLDLELR